ncbi:hypothetical protein C8A00DRAFT_14919 [Chaetomidium leptoderma]|uniref:Replication protein A subunit n=1 Tax=Chaetomidium leptoderma TaxID=669021 RepID=A0AAN6VMG7_9PEZI|nr:hypothetical protein C8A00DRAFT_14919 [Chaetomidium leptoderma]
MAEQQITQGAIEAMFCDPARAAQFPVLVMQCLHIKTLENKGPGGPGAGRYRIVLSDIRNFVQCVLATQVNHVMHEGQLQRGSIVRVRQYQAQPVKGKNIVILLDLEVITSLGTLEKIGEPKSMEFTSTEQQTTAAAATATGGTSFYGAKPEPAQESKVEVQRQLASRTGGLGGGGGGGGGTSASTIYPIEAVSPYANKWTIKARVTSKSEIRTWHKASGPGKLFSVNLLDESGEIRATGFNNEVDQFYDMLHEGSVYFISTPCKVQLAKKQFSNLPNDYELMFDRDTVIEKADDQSSVPQVRYNFCNIQELQEVEKDATVDLVGVLKETNAVDQIVSKTTQKPYDKRELVLVDDTGYSVRVTIWGKTATEFDASPESIIAFKGMRVSDFGGRSLSLLSSGTMAIDPDIPEAHKLKGWYDASGRNNTFATHSNMSSVGAATGRSDEFKTVGQIKSENLGMDQPEYFMVKGTIVHIKHENFAYPACLSENCSKKVTDMGNGTWRCEKCNITHERPQWRYILSIDVSDHTGHAWLSCFDDTARVIMGMSADELTELNASSEASFNAAFDAANCRKLVFRCRAKMDTFGEQPRVRSQVMSVGPMDYKSEGNKLAELIKQMGPTPRLPIASTIRAQALSSSTAPSLPTSPLCDITDSLQMDQLASVLLDFPPAGGLADDERYHLAVKSHIHKVDKLAVTQNFNPAAAQLLDHVHPGVNSISHLRLLIAARAANSIPQADMLAKVSIFLSTFDARQIRYAGKAFSVVLDWLVSGSLFPASVAVELLTTALLRLDPTGSVLTSHHVALAKLAFTTDNVEPALPLLEKNIVFYPGAKGLQESRPLCGLDLPPAAYITTQSGLTSQLSSSDVLQYDLLRGLCFIQRRAWSQALDALERVITYPTKDNNSCSKIMVEAHNKWILVGLLLNGKTPALPAITSPGPQKAFTALGKPYQSIGKAFEDNTAEMLNAEFASVGAQFFSEENNLNLMRLVMQHYQRWQILNLRQIYTKISLEQIRKRTQSAETAAPLATEAEMEKLVHQMIDEGMLSGVIERPADGPAYLSFLAPDEELSEAEFAQKMSSTAQRLKALEPLVKATNERLGTSRDYVRFLVGQQKKEKDGRRDYELTFLNQVEDEDLMTGVVAGF